MGRELRMVPRGWEHPKDEKGKYIPLLAGSYSERIKAWDEENEQWQKGFHSDYHGGWKPKEEKYKDVSFNEWGGLRPLKENYMPEWTMEGAVMLVMYEDTSEGTPISPAFETPEELAYWLANNGASAFGAMTASYEEWLITIKKGYAVGAIMDSRGFRSGVGL
jgi:hypothetical protein